MTAHIARIVRLCAAGVLATFPFCAAPTAFAVMPPAVDDSMLPKPGPPAPPRPTEQQERCVATPPTRVDAADGGQLKDLDLQQVWKFTRGTGQTVAVIDTGVARHRLLPHLVPGGDYVYTADGTDDCDGHGTVVAGIIGAEPDSDGSTFSGIAPDATIVSIRQSSNKFRATDDPSGAGLRRCGYACRRRPHCCGHGRDRDQCVLGRVPARRRWFGRPSARRRAGLRRRRQERRCSGRSGKRRRGRPVPRAESRGRSCPAWPTGLGPCQRRRQSRPGTTTTC